MKHIILCLLAIAALTGCSKNDTPSGRQIDCVYPVSHCYFIWVNDSDHRITMSVDSRYFTKAEEILPGNSLTIYKDEYDYDNPVDILQHAEIVFDDGPYGGVFRASGPNPEPNIMDSSLYEYEEYESEFSIWFYYWTYTFTNADYEAAVARGPMTEE